MHGARGRPGTPSFREALAKECGACHAALMATYVRSYHGASTLAGDAKTAKCSDCHGFHAVRGAEDPESEIGPAQKLDTCRTCHEGAPAGYASFWTHVDPSDPDDRPLAFAVLVAGLALSAGIVVFLGLHTLVWAARELVEAVFERRGARARADDRWLLRSEPSERGLYVVTLFALFGLAASGAPLAFPTAAWARRALDAAGGPDAWGLAHRAFALALFGCGFAFLVVLRARVVPHLRDGSFLDVLFGPGSLLPRSEDVRDIVRQVRWFFGLGPKPTWDAWAYWEKLDVWAMFWSVPLLGGTGLVLWFPEAVAASLPGWVINLAAVAHGREALLGVGVLLAVHAFHRHLRREVGPADPGVLTGRVPASAVARERPGWYERLARTGEIEARWVPPASPGVRGLARLLGVLTWVLAFGLVALVTHGLLTAA
jgi:cytochrome b subunit of formate dehydrogenase